MAIYRGVSGVNKEVTQQFRGVSGVNREISEQYRGVAGVNRLVYDTASPIMKDMRARVDFTSGYIKVDPIKQGNAWQLYLPQDNPGYPRYCVIESADSWLFYPHKEVTVKVKIGAGFLNDYYGDVYLRVCLSTTREFSSYLEQVKLTFPKNQGDIVELKFNPPSNGYYFIVVQLMDTNRGAGLLCEVLNITH